MRVLQVNSVCGVGSTGRIAADLYQALNGYGNNCKVAYGRGEAKQVPLNDSVRIASGTEVLFHAAAARVLDRAGFYSGKAARRLIRLIEEFRPEIVHLHNLHGYYVNVRILFCYLKEKSIPVVWTFHDCWPFTGHCAYFDRAGCTKWQTGCGSCMLKHEYPQSACLDRSRKNYTDKKSLFSGHRNLTIVTPSVWLKELVDQSFLREYEVEVIPNGIDLTRFKPVKSDFAKMHHIRGKKIILGVASNWDQRKGFEDFIRLSQFLPSDMQVVMVGVNEKQREMLPEGYIGIEKTSSVEELAKIYSAADVFYNPTYEDNFPTVNIEAQACGTPVAVYNSGGACENVNPACGRFLDKKDFQGLTDFVRQTDKVKCGDLCTAYAAQFAVKNMSDRYVGLYQKILDRR